MYKNHINNHTLIPKLSNITTIKLKYIFPDLFLYEVITQKKKKILKPFSYTQFNNS